MIALNTRPLIQRKTPCKRCVEGLMVRGSLTSWSLVRASLKVRDAKGNDATRNDAARLMRHYWLGIGSERSD